MFNILIFVLPALCNGLQFLQEPADAIAAENKPFWWHCTVQGQHQITYRWRFNDADIVSNVSHKILNNGTLYITDVTRADVGQYYCTISTPLSALPLNSKPVQLRLAYIPGSFSLHPSDFSGHLGSTITLQCQIPSLPPAVITWELNQRTVSIGTVSAVTSALSQLTITNTGYGSAGRYQCVAVNTVLALVRYSNTAQVTLEGKPGFSIPPTPTSAYEGAYTVLHCSVVGTNPITLSWYRVSLAEAQIVTGGRYTLYVNGSLKIQTVRPSDGGFYKCKASNQYGMTSKTVLLSVLNSLSPPVFTHLSNDVIIYQGESVTLQCQASGSPIPAITWDKVTGNISESRVSYPHNGALAITSIQPVDSGVYRCTASNTQASVAHTITITVYEKPSFVSRPQSVIVQSGGYVKLDCLVLGKPQPVLSWNTPLGRIQVPNGILQAMSTSANGTLTISHVVSRYHGTYICIATNPVATITASATLTVQVLPRFEQQPISLTSVEGGFPVFDCTASGRPIPTVSWYSMDDVSRPLHSGPQYQIYANGSLQILSVKKSQEGSYRCVIANLLGSKHAIATLTVIVPPRFTVLPESQEVEELLTTDVQLHCMATADPDPILTWLRNSLPLVYDSNMVILPNYTLQINNIRQSQLGGYTCMATNSGGSKTATATLYVKDVPYFTTIPTNTTVNSSQKAMISCRGEAREPPVYRWYTSTEQGQQITLLGQGSPGQGRGSSAYITSSGSLVIENTSPGDEGWYVCVVENSVGSIKASAYLNIQVVPSIIFSHVPSEVDSGQQATMLCNSSGDPQPSLEWYDPSAEHIRTSSQDIVVMGNSLVIKSANVTSHWGRWLCKACNILGCVQRVMQLNVKGRPVIKKAEAGKWTNTAYIRCSSVGSPIATINYLKDKLQTIKIAAPPTGHQILNNGSLIVDIGYLSSSYLCQAKNIYGLDEIIFSVPSKPVRPVAIAKEPTVIEVSWGDHSYGASTANVYEMQYTQGNVLIWLTAPRNITQSPYILQSLLPYTRYTFRVRGVNIFGPSDFSSPSYAIFTREEKPSIPINLRSDVSSNTIVIRWNEPFRINGNRANIVYEFVYTNLNTTKTVRLLRANTQLHVTLQDIPYTTVLLFKVRAGNKNIFIDQWSEWAELTLTALPNVPPVRPVITKLVARSQDVLVLEIQVKHHSEVEGFVIKYKESSTDVYAEVRVADPVKTSFLITGLKEDTMYNVRIAAYNAGGMGPFSDTRTVMTQAGVFTAASKGSLRLETGTIIGIVIGCILFVLFIVVVVVICIQQKRIKKSPQHVRLRPKRKFISKTSDDLWLSRTEMNAYDNNIDNDTVASRQSGVTGYYDLMEAEHNASGDTNLSSDSAYTMGPNMSVNSVSVRPDASDVLYKGKIKHRSVFNSFEPKSGEPLGEHTEIELETRNLTPSDAYQKRVTPSPVSSHEYEELGRPSKEFAEHESSQETSVST